MRKYPPLKHFFKRYKIIHKLSVKEKLGILSRDQQNYCFMKPKIQYFEQNQHFNHLICNLRKLKFFIQK